MTTLYEAGLMAQIHLIVSSLHSLVGVNKHGLEEQL